MSDTDHLELFEGRESRPSDMLMIDFVQHLTNHFMSKDQIIWLLAEEIDKLNARLDSIAVSKKVVKKKDPSISAPVWQAYRDAFFERYQIEPVRNARVNRSLLTMVQEIGQAPSIEVVQFYLRSNEARYTKTRHPVSLLVLDSHKLLTDMQLGRSVSNSEARALENMGDNANQAGDYLRSKYGDKPEWS